jgi:hypothetical protein
MQRANYQYWAKHHTRAAVGTFLLFSALHHSVRVVGEIAAYPLRHSRSVATYKIRRGIASLKWIAGSTQEAL